MGISIRRFFIANDGVLYRMSNARFDRMMRHPESELVPFFAGQRIRTAELVIELFNRKPFRVCRETFSIFQFDSRGYLDVERYSKQQNALVNVMLDTVFVSKTSDINVLDAIDKFVAKGGSWSPTKSLIQKIEKAALELVVLSTLK